MRSLCCVLQHNAHCFSNAAFAEAANRLQFDARKGQLRGAATTTRPINCERFGVFSLFPFPSLRFALPFPFHFISSLCCRLSYQGVNLEHRSSRSVSRSSTSSASTSASPMFPRFAVAPTDVVAIAYQQRVKVLCCQLVCRTPNARVVSQLRIELVTLTGTSLPDLGGLEVVSRLRPVVNGVGDDERLRRIERGRRLAAQRQSFFKCVCISLLFLL